MEVLALHAQSCAAILFFCVPDRAALVMVFSFLFLCY